MNPLQEFQNMKGINMVQVGETYVYLPVGIDVFYPKSTVTPGAIVKVVDLPNGISASDNTCCHITNLDGHFAGLVSTKSLRRLTWEEKQSHRQSPFTRNMG